MKCMWLIILTLLSIGCAYTESCQQWDQFLGNVGRTGYTNCNGPDSPELLWEITLEGEVESPLIIGDRVIILDKTYCSFPNPPETASDSNIIVVDLLTGTVLQKVVPEGDLVGVYPLEDVALIKVGGKLYEIYLMSEEISFASEFPPAKSFCHLECYPLVLPDKIVFPTTPVVCFSREDYSVLWDLQSSLGSLYPEDAEIWNIAASVNRIYIILEEKNGRRVLAVDPETGELIWMNELMVWRIAVEESVVYVGGNILYALDCETGEPLWTFESESIRSNIVAGPTTVYLTDTQNYLYAVDKDTGNLKWKSPWEETTPFGMTYIVGAGDTIICSNVLNMASYSAENGAKLWNVHFQDTFEPSLGNPCPAVAEGIIVVAKRGLHEENGIPVLEPYKLTALASDPDLFIKQGDAFLSEGLKNQAINSFEKAAELYEKEGNVTQFQEIRKRIYEIENLPEAASPTPSPPTPTPTTPSETPLATPRPTSPPGRPSTSIPTSALVVMGALAGILVAFYLFKQRKP